MINARRASVALLFAVAPSWVAAEDPVDQATVDAAAACTYFLSDFLERNMEGTPGATFQLLAPMGIVRSLKLGRYSEVTWLDVEWTMGSSAGVFSEVFSKHRAHITCISDQTERRILYVDIVNTNPKGPVFTDIPFTSIDVGSLAHGGRY
jgi:hypothetical protein